MAEARVLWMLMFGCLPLRANSLRLILVTSVVSAAALAASCDAGDSSVDDGSGGAPVVAPPKAGAPSASAGAASAGAPSTPGGGRGNPGGAGAPPSEPGAGSFGSPMQMVQGTSADRYAKAQVQRDGVNYTFMANGWGPNFTSQSVSWRGTSFTVSSMEGSAGPMYEPASYPTVFCGAYSDSVSGACGLPAPLSGIASIKTGWSWAPNGNSGQYNAAYDIWLSSSNATSGLTEYLMVWYRDPPGQQPAGSVRAQGVTVKNVPGTWNFWVGTVNVGFGSKPYYAYVKPEGQDIYSLEFDVMDFVRDVGTRGVTLQGTNVVSVAVGFEIWKGPVTNLVTQDFYVNVK